jgi:hypothetical protein
MDALKTSDRKVIMLINIVLQTYQDILKLHEQIDECVYERDELRELTLPLQVQDNRLRARFKEENWKLREFDEWIARQDPNWQPPPRLPHGRKKPPSNGGWQKKLVKRKEQQRAPP